MLEKKLDFESEQGSLTESFLLKKEDDAYHMMQENGCINAKSPVFKDHFEVFPGNLTALALLKHLNISQKKDFENVSQIQYRLTQHPLRKTLTSPLEITYITPEKNLQKRQGPCGSVLLQSEKGKHIELKIFEVSSIQELQEMIWEKLSHTLSEEEIKQNTRMLQEIKETSQNSLVKTSDCMKKEYKSAYFPSLEFLKIPEGILPYKENFYFVDGIAQNNNIFLGTYTFKENLAGLIDITNPGKVDLGILTEIGAQSLAGNILVKEECKDSLITLNEVILQEINFDEIENLKTGDTIITCAHQTKSRRYQRIGEAEMYIKKEGNLIPLLRFSLTGSIFPRDAILEPTEE
jgi:hypothetical protein